MYKDTRTSSAYKWMLTVAAVLLITFCFSVVCSAITVSGTVNRGGVACPKARVVLTSWESHSILTDDNGFYSLDVPTGFYTIIFNAINAVPQKMEFVYISEATTINADLLLGTVPTYDDFSGTELDTEKWDYIHPSYTMTTPQKDLTPLSASIVDGNLKINPYPTRSGIMSKTDFPSVAAFEFALPNRYEGSVDASQGFALIDWTLLPIIDFRDYLASSNNPRLYAYTYNMIGQETTVWQCTPDNLSSYPYTSRPKFTVLKTEHYIDLFVENNYLTSITTTPNFNPVHIYLYGGESAEASNGTSAYFDNIKAGIPVAATAMTLAQMKATANSGDVVTVSDGIVTASFNDTFWIESADRSTGIKVVSTAKPKVGQKMLLVGQYMKANREAYIIAHNIAPTEMATPPAVLGITGKIAAEMDKPGAAAQGLFVKVYGKVTYVETDSFGFATGYYLDDGSGLTGDGINKGLYIKMDPEWRYPASQLTDKFVTAKGPLTVEEVNGVVIPSVRATEPMPDDYPAEFIAFNDCAWDPSQETVSYTDPSTGDIYTIHFSPNVTKYTFDTANKKEAGFLMDEATGKYVPAFVKFTGYQVTVDNSIGKYNFRDGDAFIFSGALPPNDMKVNTLGTIRRSGSGYWVEMTFSGLSTDPNYRYEFVCTGRGTADTGTQSIKYNVKYEISDVIECTNSAASEVIISNTETLFGTRYNGDGYAAKWTNIVPKPDGTFKVRAMKPGTDQGGGNLLNAFMLKRVKVTP